ncbi:MAG TPA: hypothetical protein VF546_02790 [Pyrinomonadaceae bacterium]|jgi:hypothetical protein
MRRLISYAAACALLAGAAAAAAAQTQTFADPQAGYTFELPGPTWRATQRPDAEHEHTEFVNGDRGDGYLRIRKEVIEAGTTPADLSRRDHDLKLRFLAGYAEGKEEPFAGRLRGVTSSYEYTAAGKPMLGRIYYLQADPRTVYVLHFTGKRDKLMLIRSQTDAVARSFQLK